MSIASGKIAKIRHRKPVFNRKFDKTSRPTEYRVCSVGLQQNARKKYTKTLKILEICNDSIHTTVHYKIAQKKLSHEISHEYFIGKLIVDFVNFPQPESFLFPFFIY